MIANALILQNVVDMTWARHQLEASGQTFNPEPLAFIGPYWMRCIQRFGSHALRFDLPFEAILFNILTPRTPVWLLLTLPGLPT